jgi:hypothetical protein
LKTKHTKKKEMGYSPAISMLFALLLSTKTMPEDSRLFDAKELMLCHGMVCFAFVFVLCCCVGCLKGVDLKVQVQQVLSEMK